MALVTCSKPPADQTFGSAIASAPHVEQGGDRERSQRRGRDEEQGHEPGSPSGQGDGLAARPVWLDESEPLQDHPELTVRHTTGFGLSTGLLERLPFPAVR